jgi:hypothetical protein
MRLSKLFLLCGAIASFSVVVSAAVVSSADAQSTPKGDTASRADSMKLPEMGGMKTPAKATQPVKPSAPMAMPARVNAQAPDMTMVPNPLGITMERLGSGTTWIPDAVSLPSRRFMAGSWNLMAHGFVFAQYDHQSGSRGDEQFGSLNWAMVMASHSLAGGRFQVRTMLSLDPASVTARGYPLLLQSGESYRGERLHDRQHPHDFWMELAAMYERPINDRFGVSLYAAPSGEPALGPVAFMHRPSAMDNLAAPLAHHWQDATHVSFGVVTVGLFTHDWKIEASAFNGREPDEHRWNFDPIRLDSYSARATFNPTVDWSFTAGYGFVKSPEAMNPEESIHRVTASALHGKPIGVDGQWASAIIWGANSSSATTRTTHSVTAETEAILDSRNTVLGRAEFVQKTAEDLSLGTRFSLADEFNVGALSVGYIRELLRVSSATFGLGALATLNFVPSELQNEYGSRHPTGLMVFARLRPARQQTMAMKPMKGME